MPRSRHTTLAVIALATLTLAPALAVALSAPSPLGAAGEDAPVTLTSRATRAEWQGRQWDVAATPPAPEACTRVTCDVRELVIDVPADDPLRGSGAELVVSARWTLEQNDFELYLLDALGVTRLGASEGGFSVSETLVVPLPASGTYRVVLVPLTVTDARAEFAAEARPVIPLPEGDLLPNLVTRPPFDLKLMAPVFYATGTGISVGGERGVVSCYPDETAEEGAKRCLRFSNTISNTGTGDLEVRFDVSGLATGYVDGESHALWQRIHNGDGSYRDVRAGSYEVHATHGHLHYESFAEYSVRAWDPVTRTLGGVVAVGHKSGFCPEDVTQERWDAPDTRARRFSFPACNIPNHWENERPWIVQGVTAGWGDTYTWDLPDQYVEISDLPDGTYALVSTADPLGTLVESDTTDNTAVTVFRLEGDTVEELEGWEGLAPP